MSADPRPGKSSRSLSGLCPCIRTLCLDLIEQVSFATTLIETLRDATRQAYYMRIGVSWTPRSLHLPQPPHGLALAFDLAPREYLKLKGWHPGGQLWAELGERGKDLGLGWGGDWSQKDRPHFQIPTCRCAQNQEVA